MTETAPSPLGKVITIDDERIKNHLDRVSSRKAFSAGFFSSATNSMAIRSCSSR